MKTLLDAVFEMQSDKPGPHAPAAVHVGDMKRIICRCGREFYGGNGVLVTEAWEQHAALMERPVTTAHPLLAGSMMNVHARGVDSIVLKGAPGMVRIFVARPEHELWQPNGCLLKVGVHAHHCDLTLVPLFGEIHQIAAAMRHREERKLYAFHYHSAIGSVGRFERIGAGALPFEMRSSPLDAPLAMAASDQHTISVAEGRAAAWMVCEGDEDPTYLPITYSDADLTRFDFSGMYQPMTAERLAEDLALLAENGVRL